MPDQFGWFLCQLWTILDRIRPYNIIFEFVGPNWTYFDQFRHVWTCLDLYWPIWTNLDPYGPIWTPLDIIGHNCPIWTHLVPFGQIWTNLYPLGHILTYIFLIFAVWEKDSAWFTGCIFLVLVLLVYTVPAGINVTFRYTHVVVTLTK